MAGRVRTVYSLRLHTTSTASPVSTRESARTSRPTGGEPPVGRQNGNGTQCPESRPGRARNERPPSVRSRAGSARPTQWCVHEIDLSAGRRARAPASPRRGRVGQASMRHVEAREDSGATEHEQNAACRPTEGPTVEHPAQRLVACGRDVADPFGGKEVMGPIGLRRVRPEQPVRPVVPATAPRLRPRFQSRRAMACRRRSGGHFDGCGRPTSQPCVLSA